MLTFGNHKLGDDTAIFNMSTALECPSRRLGLCRTINQGVKCYAEKPEVQYKDAVINHRKSQAAEWQSKSSTQLLTEFTRKIQARRKDTRYLRYNESGDFCFQSDIEKLSYISRGLREIGVITYGYTARSDLDFRGINFLCKGSGFSAEGHIGMAIVINKDQPVPEGYHLCPADCRRCNLCKCNHPFNIVFRKH